MNFFIINIGSNKKLLDSSEHIPNTLAPVLHLECLNLVIAIVIRTTTTCACDVQQNCKINVLD